jgi:predicted RNA binding protein YcfA (HicA-like mRNA interferase family)
MPKLPPLSPQKVIAILEKKGFVLKKVTGSHYIFANAETKDVSLFLFIAAKMLPKEPFSKF